MSDFAPADEIMGSSDELMGRYRRRSPSPSLRRTPSPSLRLPAPSFPSKRFTNTSDDEAEATPPRSRSAQPVRRSPSPSIDSAVERPRSSVRSTQSSRRREEVIERCRALSSKKEKPAEENQSVAPSDGSVGSTKRHKLSKLKAASAAGRSAVSPQPPMKTKEAEAQTYSQRQVSPDVIEGLSKLQRKALLRHKKLPASMENALKAQEAQKANETLKAQEQKKANETLKAQEQKKASKMVQEPQKASRNLKKAHQFQKTNKALKAQEPQKTNKTPTASPVRSSPASSATFTPTRSSPAANRLARNGFTPPLRGTRAPSPVKPQPTNVQASPSRTSVSQKSPLRAALEIRRSKTLAMQLASSASPARELKSSALPATPEPPSLGSKSALSKGLVEKAMTSKSRRLAQAKAANPPPVETSNIKEEEHPLVSPQQKAAKEKIRLGASKLQQMAVSRRRARAGTPTSESVSLQDSRSTNEGSIDPELAAINTLRSDDKSSSQSSQSKVASVPDDCSETSSMPDTNQNIFKPSNEHSFTNNERSLFDTDSWSVSDATFSTASVMQSNKVIAEDVNDVSSELGRLGLAVLEEKKDAEDAIGSDAGVSEILGGYDSVVKVTSKEERVELADYTGSRFGPRIDDEIGYLSSEDETEADAKDAPSFRPGMVLDPPPPPPGSKKKRRRKKKKPSSKSKSRGLVPLQSARLPTHPEEDDAARDTPSKAPSEHSEEQQSVDRMADESMEVLISAKASVDSTKDGGVEATASAELLGAVGHSPKNEPELEAEPLVAKASLDITNDDVVEAMPTAELPGSTGSSPKVEPETNVVTLTPQDSAQEHETNLEALSPQDSAQESVDKNVERAFSWNTSSSTASENDGNVEDSDVLSVAMRSEKSEESERMFSLPSLQPLMSSSADHADDTGVEPISTAAEDVGEILLVNSGNLDAEGTGAEAEVPTRSGSVVDTPENQVVDDLYLLRWLQAEGIIESHVDEAELSQKTPADLMKALFSRYDHFENLFRFLGDKFSGTDNIGPVEGFLMSNAPFTAYSRIRASNCVRYLGNISSASGVPSPFKNSNPFLVDTDDAQADRTQDDLERPKGSGPKSIQGTVCGHPLGEPVEIVRFVYLSCRTLPIKEGASTSIGACEPGTTEVSPSPDPVRQSTVNDEPTSDNSLPRYSKPPTDGSPFTATSERYPAFLGVVLDFIGDPTYVCRTKMLCKSCHAYVESNEHQLIRNAVRLGGISKNVRPYFWLWVALRKSGNSSDFFENSYSESNDRLHTLETDGAQGKWRNVIDRDVSRSFGNFPPHKTGARLRTDSIVRALATWGKSRILKRGVRGSGEAPFWEDDKFGKGTARTTAVSEWEGISPVGSFTGSVCSGIVEDRPPQPEENRSEVGAEDLALSGNSLSEEEKALLREKLQFILHCLAAAHPDVGYCQGMDYVVAHLLRVLRETIHWEVLHGRLPSDVEATLQTNPDLARDSEELQRMYATVDSSKVVENVCFRIMDTLFTNYSLRHFYWPELRCLKTCCLVFEKLIKIKLPVLADHFEHHELNVGLFCLGWFQTLFLYLPSMPSATVCHMWDIWLVERSFKIFFRVGTAILFLSQPTLLNLELEGMMGYLNTFPDATVLSPDILIACALQIKVTNRMIMEIEQGLSNEA